MLQHFSSWAGMQEHGIEGYKFVTERPRSALERFENPNEDERAQIERKREERAKKKQKKSEDGEDGGEAGEGEGESVVAGGGNAAGAVESGNGK